MQAPRRLQLRRGNTAAISTYVGAPGELIVDTTTNTLYLHNGVTAGGIATTVNTASITSNISSLQGNITTLTANAGVQAGNIASLTSSVTAANAAIVTANTNMKGYVDAANTIQTNQITTVSSSVTGANAAIVTANTNMKGYVDNLGSTKANLSGANFTGNVTATNFIGTVSLASAATTLQTARTINGVSFNGSANITLPTVNTSGNQDIGGRKTFLYNGVGVVMTGFDEVETTPFFELKIQAQGIDSNSSGLLVGQYGINGDGTGNFIDSSRIYNQVNGPLVFGTNNTERVRINNSGNVGIGNTNPRHTLSVNGSTNITGNVTAAYFVGNGALLTGIAAGTTYSNSNVASYLPTYSGNISANISKAGYTWTFGTDGTTTFPTGVRLSNARGPNTVNFTTDIDKSFQIETQTASTSKLWNFTTDGNLTLPQNANINFANGVSILSTVTDLYANAAVQAGNIATIFANLGATSGSLATLTANAASQAGSLATITSVLTSSNVGIGSYAGLTSQGQYAVAIGIYAGSETQGERAVAIGSNAGKTSQGAYAVAIGRRAGETNQGNNSIIINATTGVLNQTTANTFTVAPVRNDVANISQIMFYNTTSKEVTYGNTIDIAGNVSTTGYFLGNGALLTGIAASSNYSNVDVANYLPTYTGNIANIRLGTSGVLTFADGTTMTTAATGGGSDYGNANVATFLANSRTTFFGNTSTHPLSSNVTQIFIGNSTSLTSGNGTSPFAAALMYNMYFAANNASLVRNTQLGAGMISLDLNGFTVAGLATSQTANSAPTLTNLLRITSAGAATFVGTATAAGVTSTAAIAVNSALGITSNQATQLIFNQTVSTITMGGSASTINLGTTTGTAGNVFVGSTLGTNNYNLRLRANGQYNLVTQLTSAGGYATTTYSNIAVTGGSGTGMIISMNGVASGYLGSANITNPGTGYVNGDTLTIPAGNPVGSLGGSFVVQNYNANRSSAQIGTGIWTYHIEGNLTAPGNISISSNSSYFIGNALGTTAAYTGNVSAANFIGNTTGTTATYTGNVTAQNFIGNISITGNVTGTSSNVTLQAGSFSSTFDNQGNVTMPGNVIAPTFVGSGARLTGVALKTTGSWTVPTGNSTQSFTVPAGNTYQLWVDCNISNGILAWNATATVTNTNVPVVGQQFAWVYNGGGTPVDFTSIPNQFVGTGNTIVRSSASPGVTTNRFDFGISNTSGGNITVRYGYVSIS